MNGNQIAIFLTHKSDGPATTQLLVPGYRYKESSGVGDIKVNIGTDDRQSVVIGKNGLVMLIYEKKNSNK